MPFVLSPNFSKLLNKKNVVKKERWHQDAIFFDMDSPEAFDEVFFNNSEDFIRDELTKYIDLVLAAAGKGRYLSKNNLNYRRLHLIRSLLPNAVFLIPVREPLQQAYSLMHQHKRFCQLQREDDFIRRYMNYLGHNEFGLDHIPWNRPASFYDPNNINYWLEQWLLFYRHIQDRCQNDEQSYFIIYEELTSQNYVKRLLKMTHLQKREKMKLPCFKNSNKEDMDQAYNARLYSKARSLYIKLKDQVIVDF